MTDPDYDVLSDTFQIFNELCDKQEDSSIVEVKAYLLAKQYWLTDITIKTGERPSEAHLHRLAFDSWKSFVVAVGDSRPIRIENLKDEIQQPTGKQKGS